MVLANPASNYIKGTQNTENACIINATYAGRGRGGGSFGRSSSINKTRLAVFFEKKEKLHIPSVVDCILCTAEVTVALLYLRT